MGVSYLPHAKGLMHGDLYAHNILWNAEGDCRLGDFGAATPYPPGESASELIEVLAFGRLLAELLARCEDTAAPLEALAARCLSARPGDRPLFREVLAAL